MQQPMIEKQAVPKMPISQPWTKERSSLSSSLLTLGVGLGVLVVIAFGLGVLVVIAYVLALHKSATLQLKKQRTKNEFLSTQNVRETLSMIFKLCAQKCNFNFRAKIILSMHKKYFKNCTKKVGLEVFENNSIQLSKLDFRDFKMKTAKEYLISGS